MPSSTYNIECFSYKVSGECKATNLKEDSTVKKFYQ